MKLLFSFGTRPEAIKMAPLIREALKRKHEVVVCISGQHKEMITPFLDFFEIEVQYNLNVNRIEGTLSELTALIITSLDQVLKKVLDPIHTAHGFNQIVNGPVSRNR